jgi:hypothetical protein
MGDFNNINNQVYSFEPIKLVDTVSSTFFYIGVSINGNVPSKANWKIKRIWQDGTVWKTEFPNGDQSFSFIWDNRNGYTYQ